MANSIEAALRRDEEEGKYGKIISSVLLTLRNHVTDDKVMVIVEGIDDRRLYERMYNVGKVIIYVVGNSRHTIEVIKVLNPKGYDKRLIGIKDADFDNVNKKSYSYPNLFLTDWHDAEIVELESDSVIDTVWSKYMGFKAPIDAVENIYKDLCELSMLKWANYNLRLNVVFKRNSIGACVNRGKFDFEMYKANLLTRNENPENKFAKDYRLWYFVHAMRLNSDDMPNITNGHDAVELMYHNIKSQKSLNIAYKDFAQDIRDSYPVMEYRQTKMAMAIDNWAVKNIGTSLY